MQFCRTAVLILTLVTLPLSRSLALDERDSAWFLDSTKTVNYCVIRDDKFSLNIADLNSTIDWAFVQWVSYMDSVKLNQRPQAFSLARQFHQVANCADADLQFLFGIQNAQIEQYKKQDFFHPISFARRTQFNSKTGWGKGLLWVADDSEFIDPLTAKSAIAWGDRIKMKAILLHELGHVFGVGHWDATIMKQDILTSLLVDSNAYNFTHITNSWELTSISKSIWKTGDQYNELGEMNATAFFKLVGRAPQGVIHGQWITDQQQILVQDDLGQYVFSTHFSFEREVNSQQTPLFFAEHLNQAGQLESINEKRETYLKIGALKSLSGEQVSIIVEKNTADRHLSISYQSGFRYEFLFSQPCQSVVIPFHRTVCLGIYPKDEG